MPNDLENVEDLTLFADESFDTDDVDLFEFTGDSDSPLTRLKSIILSLDWEISDEILQELIDEIDNLQQVWQGDKVAQVYLQGLHKIGNYLRAEGAYSHPNAIKLLLSFFYNFEKIISSEKITGDAITTLLKADVRKFRILQYQINQKTSISHIATEENSSDELAISGEESVAEIPECEPLTCLKATILGLEWEVTDKGLDQFNSQIADIREHFMENKSAQVLIQGLQALGGYITDERADAHPEAFSMLHSFYEGLELLLDEKNIDEEEKQNVLIDRVNRLNALKVVIAETKKQKEAEESEEILDEILTPIASEAKTDLLETEENHEEKPLEALAGVDALAEPDLDDFLDPSAITPVEDKIADDFIEQELLVGGAIAGAVALSGDEDEIDLLEEEPIEEEKFEEELDLFFTDEEESIFDTGANEDEQKLDDNFEDLELTFTEEEFDLDFSDGDVESTDGAGSEKADEIDEEFDQLFVEEDDTGLQPALADAEEEGGFNETEIASALPEVPSDEIDDKLDAFFGLDEEEEEEKRLESTFESVQEEAVAPALADAEEEGGFNEDETVTTLAEEPSAEIEDKLDAFFGLDEDEEKEFTPTEDENVDDELVIAPALADAEEEGGFNEDEAVATMTEEPSAEIEDKLDAFFGLDEEEEKEFTPTEQENVDDELVIAPALADAEEEGGFNEDEAVATMTEEPSAEIEDKLDAFFGLDTETPPTVTEETESDKISLDSGLVTTLGAGLTAFAAKGTIEQLRESKKIVQQLQKGSASSAEQKVLLSLLDSTLGLIPEEDGKEREGMEKITELSQSLQQQLEKKEITSLDLCMSLGHTVSVLAAEIIDLRKKVQ